MFDAEFEFRFRSIGFRDGPTEPNRNSGYASNADAEIKGPADHYVCIHLGARMKSNSYFDFVIIASCHLQNI